MKFRTEIEVPAKQPLNISHDSSIVMLGSCFTDNIGEILEKDGFKVTHNPMGPLYNPASLARTISLSLGIKRDLTLKRDNNGLWHCLDFAMRYTYENKDELIAKVNSDLDLLANDINNCTTLIITLGTAFVFRLQDDTVVGNCHKFPSSDFSRSCLAVEEVSRYISDIASMIPKNVNLIFTVSPIRHTADTLHGNQLSKATLQLGITPHLSHQLFYFPAYEIMIDDLRDYRFYADDLKHPSTMAVEYIYEKFQQYYMSPKTIGEALVRRKESKRASHRQILPHTK